MRLLFLIFAGATLCGATGAGNSIRAPRAEQQQLEESGRAQLLLRGGRAADGWGLLKRGQACDTHTFWGAVTSLGIAACGSDLHCREKAPGKAFCCNVFDDCSCVDKYQSQGYGGCG